MNEKLINGVVEKFGISNEEAISEYQRIESECKKMFSFTTPEDFSRRVDLNFARYFKDLSKSRTTVFEGIFYSISTPNFISRKRIDNIMKAYNENAEETISKGYVKMINGVPIAIDNMPLWNVDKANEKKNPNFGMPLDAEKYDRMAEGVVTYENQVVKFRVNLAFQVTNVKTKAKTMKETKIPLYKPVKFNMAIKSKLPDGTLILSVRKNTRLTVLDKQTSLLAVIKSLFPVTPISQIESIVASNRENKIFGDIRLIQGQVLDMNLSPEQGKPSFRLIEESLDLLDTADIRIFLQPEIAEIIDFGDYSTVLVLGSPWVLAENEKNSKLVGMTAYGVYPIEKANPNFLEPVVEGDVK